MFSIYDGRDCFYQWDTERKLIVLDESIKQVHFCNKTEECSLVCEVYKEGELSLVNVPNVLLQDNWRINVYGYDENYTKHEKRFNVKARSKPVDYVYTETECKRWEDLEERMEALEGKGVADWAENNPESPNFIKNRTHWVDNEGGTITFDGNTEGKEVIDLGVTMVKVSNDVLTKEDFIGKKIVIMNTEAQEKIEAEILESFVDESDEGLVNVVIMEEIPVIMSIGEDIEGISKGLYFACIDSMGYVSMLEVGKIHKLDCKYLPDSIIKSIESNTKNIENNTKSIESKVDKTYLEENYFNKEYFNEAVTNAFDVFSNTYATKEEVNKLQGTYRLIERIETVEGQNEVLLYPYLTDFVIFATSPANSGLGANSWIVSGKQYGVSGNKAFMQFSGTSGSIIYTKIVFNNDKGLGKFSYASGASANSASQYQESRAFIDGNIPWSQVSISRQATTAFETGTIIELWGLKYD